MNEMIECTNHGCDYGWDVVGKKITDELWITDLQNSFVGKTMKYCSDDGCCWNVILWVLQSFVVKKKNTTSITEVLRREEVNGRNCELLMETRRRWEEGQGEEGYFGQKIIEQSLMFNKYGMLLMNLYGWTIIIIRVSHSSTNIPMFSKKSLIVDTPHHTFYHINKHLHTNYLPTQINQASH